MCPSMENRPLAMSMDQLQSPGLEEMTVRTNQSNGKMEMCTYISWHARVYNTGAHTVLLCMSGY